MVLPDRIELSTSPLPRECSTTELRQRRRAGGAGPGAGMFQAAETAIGAAGTQGAGAFRVAGFRDRLSPGVRGPQSLGLVGERRVPKTLGFSDSTSFVTCTGRSPPGMTLGVGATPTSRAPIGSLGPIRPPVGL